jgi:hypothetical protein
MCYLTMNLQIFFSQNSDDLNNSTAVSKMFIYDTNNNEIITNLV